MGMLKDRDSSRFIRLTTGFVLIGAWVLKKAWNYILDLLALGYFATYEEECSWSLLDVKLASDIPLFQFEAVAEVIFVMVHIAKLPADANIIPGLKGSVQIGTCTAALLLSLNAVAWHALLKH